MQITKSIVTLLRTYDCVIMPEVGAFVGSYAPAIKDGNTITPPSKNISFNSSLKIDDGVIISFIAKCNNIEYSKAKSTVYAECREINRLIDLGEAVNFEGLGSISLNRHNRKIFSSACSTNLLSSCFGYDTTNLIEIPKENTISTSTVNRGGKIREIRLLYNRKIINRVAIIIPLTLALTVITHRTNLFNNNYKASSIEIPAKIITDFTTNVNSSIDNGIDNIVNISDAVVNNSIETSNIDSEVVNIEIEEAPVEYIYGLVAGVFSQSLNGEKYVNTLKTRGYADAYLETLKSGKVRVYFSKHATIEEAKSCANDLRDTSWGEDVWIKNIK